MSGGVTQIVAQLGYPMYFFAITSPIKVATICRNVNSGRTLAFICFLEAGF